MDGDADKEIEPYAEYTALIDLFGDHPKTKILAVLLSQGQDINITQIASLAGISRSTVYNHIDTLIELDVVEKTREIGGGGLYQINRRNETAKLLAQTEWNLISHYDDTEQPGKSATHE